MNDRARALLSQALAIGRQARLALLVLAAGVALSFFAWRFAEQRVTGEATIQFQQNAAQAIEAIDRRVQSYIDLVSGLKGLFQASDGVTRKEFGTYLSAFHMEERYPGVRLISYASRVSRAERAAFERRVQHDRSVVTEGYPQFSIKPPGERAEYLPVEYIEPMAANESSFGLDLLAEKVRAQGVFGARDSGQHVATAPFFANVEPKRLSFAIRTAIYRRGMPLNTVAQRKDAFAGVVAVLVDVHDLLYTLLEPQFGKEFDVVVHDVGPSSSSRFDTPSRSNLVFESRPGMHANVAAFGPDLSRIALLDVAGRQWRLMFFAPAVTQGIERALPLIVLQGGILTSLLLAWLIWTLSVSRARALQIAEQTTAVDAAARLRAQLLFIQELIEAIPHPIFFKDTHGHYLGLNRAWERFFGVVRAHFIGKSVFDFYPHNLPLAERHHAMDRALLERPGSQSYDVSVVAGDGRTHHTIYSKATFNNADGSVAGLIGLITDITELKEAESALRQSEARFRDLAELSSDWYWEQDSEFRFTEMSSKVDDLYLDPQEHIGKTRWQMSALGVTEEQWEAHKALLRAHRPFHEFVYQRYDRLGTLRTISVSGRPIFDERGAFLGYRGTARDITAQRAVEDQIRHMAHHDALTGLPNRTLLHDRVEQAIGRARRHGKHLALLFIDLDRFKTVNDSLGHSVGDQLLCVVAQRLVLCVRATDTVARIGGDEFVVVLSDLEQNEYAAQIAQKVLDGLTHPAHIGEHELQVTPSVGICTYPQDGEDVHTLMRNADAAMYHAKELGRNNYQFFTEAMSVAAHERLLLENDLRHALERHELVLYYQPQLALATEEVIGFEALLRWMHPHRGLVPPAQFVPLAEEAGLISGIGEWVLEQACAQARRWHEAGHRGLQISVNCSAQQFRREHFVESVKHILRETKLPPDCLEIEITESVIIQHSESIMARLQSLAEAGVRLALDDFGTGYSSLSYLKRFPIEKLKIDQSFVRDVPGDPEDAAIVTAIVAMAHSLGMEVTAEGVENAEQLAFLKSLGCDKAQGYYFGKPLPAHAFADLLRSPARHRTAANR